MSEAQEPLEQVDEALGLLVDRRDKALTLVGAGSRQEARVAPHRREGVAQLVRHPGSEFAKTRHLLPLRQCPFESFQPGAIGEEHDLSLRFPAGGQQRQAPHLDHPTTQVRLPLGLGQRRRDRTAHPQ